MTGSVLDFNDALPLAALEARARRHEVDAEDVKARITADAQGFVAWMFSGRAHVARGEARIGDVYGTPGASLSIALSGPSAGLWKDHATDQGGDLIALYQACMGYEGNRNFGLAIKEIAAEFLGDPVEVRRGPFQPTAEARIAEKKVKLGTLPRPDMVELGAPVATWRYVDLRGNQLASVVRFEPDGTPASKTYRPFCYRTINGQPKWAAGAPDIRPLYNLPGIATETVVILCEGEKAAQALIDLGIAATTAMQGAEAPIEKTDWSPLNGKTVVVWPDNDAPGARYGAAAATRLVALGCTVRVVPIPDYAGEKWDAADAVSEGRDVRGLIEASVRVEDQEEDREAVRFYTLEELEHRPPPDWLVEGVLVERGMGLLWAGSDSYKTFFAIDIGMCIGTGTPWLGHAVKAGRVLYVAAEDADGVAIRMLGWRETRGVELPRADLRVHIDGVTLVGEEGDRLVAAIEAMDQKPILTIIDTLARTFGAGNENQTQDMNAYVGVADRIRRVSGGAVLFVHHSGRDIERERGNLALRAACNTIIAVKRDGDRLTLINAPPKGKQKNASPFPDIALRMQKVAFSVRGQEHTTLIVMPDDNPLPPASEDEAPKLGKVQKAVLAALQKAGDQPLGLTSLTALTRAQKNSVLDALGSLEGRGMVLKIEGDPATWSLELCNQK